MLKEIIPSKFKIVDGNCSGDSQSFNGLVVLNDYFCLRVCDIDTFNDCLFPDAIHNISFCIEDIEFNSFFSLSDCRHSIFTSVILLYHVHNIHSICSVCAVRSAFCVLLMPTVLLFVFNALLPSVAALHLTFKFCEDGTVRSSP